MPQTATVGEAIQTMLAVNIGAILVVDGQGCVLGVFSERDVLTKIAGLVPDYAGRPLSEFMTPGPETVRPSDTLAFVLHKMDIGGYRHLPVLQDGKPIAMISVRDMLRHVTNLCHT
jgi:CBS domain-containing protein